MKNKLKIEDYSILIDDLIEYLKPVAIKYVDENYEHEERENSSDGNDELFLTKDHCKRIHQISFLMKILIIVNADYFYFFTEKEL